MENFSHEKGSALVVALFVFALAVVVVTGLLERQSISIHRMANLFDFSQAMLYALGLETWAGEVLRRDSEDKDHKRDHLGEAWAAEMAPFKVEHGEVLGKITDQQGLFNLNNLVKNGVVVEAQRAAFQRLLKSLDIESEIADAVSDWLDPDHEPFPLTGVEENDYLNLKPPYRTADRSFGSVSELRLIKGMTEENYLKLAPHVCALPSKETLKVNVNTATIPVLMSLSDKIAKADAEQLVLGRGNEGYKEVEAFLNEEALKTKLTPGERDRVKNEIAVESHFFLVRAKARIGRGVAVLKSVIERQNDRHPVLSRAWENGAWNE